MLEKIEEKGYESNLDIFLLTNTTYKKTTPNCTHIKLDLDSIKYFNIKNNLKDRDTLLEIDKLIKELSDNYHCLEDIIDLEVTQKEYGYTSRKQAKSRLIYLYDLHRKILKQRKVQEAYVITINAIDIDRASFNLACHSLGYKVIFFHSIPIKENTIIFSYKMYSEYIKKEICDQDELNLNIDGDEHAVSMIDKKINPLKYIKRSINESKHNSLKNYISGFYIRLIFWHFKRNIYNLLNLTIFFILKATIKYLKSNQKYLKKSKKVIKKVIYIGSTKYEGFQYSSNKNLNQDKIIDELIRLKKSNQVNITYRPHPASLRERNYLPLFMKLLIKGINLDLNPRITFYEEDIYLALSSSIIYEALRKNNQCFTLISGFYNLIGVETIEIKNLKNILNNNNFNRKQENLDFSIIKNYSHPGNLYYLTEEDIERITTTFCSFVKSQN